MSGKEISVDFALPTFGKVVRMVERGNNWTSSGPGRIYNGKWQALRGPFRITPTHWEPICGEQIPAVWPSQADPALPK